MCIRDSHLYKAESEECSLLWNRWISAKKLSVAYNESCQTPGVAGETICHETHATKKRQRRLLGLWQACQPQSLKSFQQKCRLSMEQWLKTALAASVGPRTVVGYWLLELEGRSDTYCNNWLFTCVYNFLHYSFVFFIVTNKIVYMFVQLYICI